MGIPLVGLPITVVSCNYAGHEYLHHDVNNLSPSREFDIEANKMTLIDLSRCILCVCIIGRPVMPQQLEEQVSETDIRLTPVQLSSQWPPGFSSLIWC